MRVRAATIVLALTAVPITTAIALNKGPLVRASTAGLNAYAAAASAISHLFEPPTALQAKASLEELANTRIPGREGHEILSYVARPGSAPEDADLPVLIMLHEFFGLNPSIVDKAQLFADELECVVVAPDMFRGTSTSFIPKAIWLAATTPQDRVNDDLDDVVSWARAQKLDTKRLAVMGFCLGGGKALRYTTGRRPDAATCVWYGQPLTEAYELGMLRAPVCGVFGADDMQIPQSLVNKFREALEEADIEHEVVSYYGGGHAFFKDVQQVKDEEMPTIAAYRLTTNFLRNYFQDNESFARKRMFLEFQLREAQRQAEEAADVTADGGDEEFGEEAEEA